jgi:beta-glucosidase
LASKQLQALLIYGSPYVLNRFLPHLPPELPHLFCYGQMPSAQQVMMERLFDQEQLQSAQSRDRAFTT